ncbi:MAG: galactokinase [Bacteroidetes bacterium]|nr:MAG: galactokinase [Bacteroidota bacterium]
METSIRRQFYQRFGKEAFLVAAPGRVNLIGEHTDYNQGYVLPAAIDKKIYIGISKNDKPVLRVFAAQYQQELSFSLDQLAPVEGWPTYLLGMIYYLQKDRGAFEGLDVYIDGNIPIGAGMSSSAAICTGFGLAMNELFNLGFTRMQLALAAQKTEHNFAGLMCGIMDQFAVLHGKSGHVIKLDCRNMDYEYIPFHFPDYRVVLVNSMVSHSLAGSEYNVRRAQCEEGISILQKYYPDIQSLRDVTGKQLELHKNILPEIVYRRCHFIVHENERLLQGCDFLSKDNLGEFGKLMFETQEGLSKWYEVSCPESDFLSEEAKTYPGVMGARQMGGGFGGCTINIVREDVIEDFAEFIQKKYTKKFNKVPEIYITQIEDGAHVVR